MEGGSSSSSSTNRGSDEGNNSNLQIITTTNQTHQVSPALIKSSNVNQSSEPDGPDLDVVSFAYDLSDFPEDLLCEILIRLPVKSGFRFKCVCKEWQSLISRLITRRFRIFYRYIYVDTFKEVLKRIRPDVYVSPEFSVLFLSTSEERQQYDQFKILAVSNGLIMCCLMVPFTYYVCDPLTRQWITLPSPHNGPEFLGEGLVSKINEYNVVTSYKAVRVKPLSMESDFLNLQTFSSETGTWTEYRLVCPKPIRMPRLGVGPIHFNGILHWFVYNHGMVAFDPYRDTQQCRLIQFPEGRGIKNGGEHDGLYRLCDECQGKLRYFEVAPESSGFYFSMWALNDYEKGEWLLEFQVSRIDLWSNDGNLSSWLPVATFIPLSFHPFNLDVVYLRLSVGKCYCIVSYNIRAKRMDVSCQPNGVVEDLSWRVVVPAVLPVWPTPLPHSA